MSCPCGNTKSLDECCGPLVKGESFAETAEALMRSRYTAYTTQEVDYIIATHEPDSRDTVDRDGALKWSEEATWDGLEIVSTEAGGAADDEGMVEFIARYSMEGAGFAHHEKSTFTKIDGRWYYKDGEMIKQQPVRRDTPKVGRNEPCPCGSGKKYKKCCGKN